MTTTNATDADRAAVIAAAIACFPDLMAEEQGGEAAFIVDALPEAMAARRSKIFWESATEIVLPGSSFAWLSFVERDAGDWMKFRDRVLLGFAEDLMARFSPATAHERMAAETHAGGLAGWKQDQARAWAAWYLPEHAAAFAVPAVPASEPAALPEPEAPAREPKPRAEFIKSATEITAHRRLRAAKAIDKATAAMAEVAASVLALARAERQIDWASPPEERAPYEAARARHEKAKGKGLAAVKAACRALGLWRSYVPKTAEDLHHWWLDQTQLPLGIVIVGPMLSQTDRRVLVFRHDGFHIIGL